jgi:creatinine amidohydrolase
MPWHERPFSGLDSLAGDAVAVLPLGAVEAHGPHLPVGTDVWIAEAMAREGARLLAAAGVEVLVLPSIAYAPAPFADGFAGTLSIRPETLTELIVDLAAALGRRGVATLALANAHFDPAQVGALRAAVERIRERGAPRVVFPDVTRRALAARLGDEFRSGAAHAGRYETSILLAERPDLVDDAARRALAAVPVSLSDAIRAGRADFAAAGLDAAYCGDPAAASAAEGRALVAELGRILAEAVTAE